MKKVLLFFAVCSLLSAASLLEKIDRNLQPSSSESYKKIINVEPNGSKKEFLLYQARKGKDKMVSLFLQPDSEKGRSTLRRGDNMWLYIPNVGKPIRIASMQSVVGGVFNNSDIMRLDFSAEYKVVAQKESGSEYTLTLKAKNRSVAYDKLSMVVDKKSLTPKKVVCYSSTGVLIKTLIYKKIKRFATGIVRPSIVETVSPFYKGYKSIMVYGKITPRNFANEVFTLNNISKVGSIRR
ncbi:MAG: outer membrane lipoprotein-sorting protein [Campylobacterota bacterium]|nr:outer membrane lipoprotein-sorting protein [Campylobacterota bacterium]